MFDDDRLSVEGTASYYTVVVDRARSEDAGWYCPETTDVDRAVEGRVAFWRA